MRILSLFPVCSLLLILPPRLFPWLRFYLLKLKPLVISITCCYQLRWIRGRPLCPSRSSPLTPVENWPHPAFNSSFGSLSRICDARGKKRKRRNCENEESAPHRAARDMFTVTVHDRRVDDPAARLMVIIRERGRSERCGVVKRWFRPSLHDPVARRRQSRDAESPIYVEMRSRMPSYFIERIIYRSGARPTGSTDSNSADF